MAGRAADGAGAGLETCECAGVCKCPPDMKEPRAKTGTENSPQLQRCSDMIQHSTVSVIKLFPSGQISSWKKCFKAIKKIQTVIFYLYPSNSFFLK